MRNYSAGENNLEEINSINKSTYDRLSSEYENRTDISFKITKHVVDLYAKYLKPHGKILETGCAVGLAMKILNNKGFVVTGIDISSEMVKLAKLRNSGCKIIEGDFLTYKFSTLYDGIFSFAFVHLFPKEVAMEVLKKMFGLLKKGGILYLGTSKSNRSSEGWEQKKDYKPKLSRFRKHWTEQELRNALEKVGFKILDVYILTDPYAKVWMDFVAIKK